LIIDASCPHIPEEVTPAVSGTMEFNLLHALGFSNEELPLAAWLASYHQRAGEWVILSPIIWEATHNDAFINASGGDLLWSKEESHYWYQVFAEYFAAAGMKMHYHNTHIWLLENAAGHPLNSVPVHQTLNQSLMPLLSQLDEHLFWQKLITESQMLFAANARKSAVNGLWPWGNAPLTVKAKKKLCVVPAYLSLAQHCCTEVEVYQPGLNLKNYEVLLLADINDLSPAHQKQIEQGSHSWYWNNVAYTVPKKNWLRHLWRKITHAD
ncbi:MAG: hypothetical protein BGO90_08830, partial [Legionella sp. 40-6]